jgi:hypothetical protein
VEQGSPFTGTAVPIVFYIHHEKEPAETSFKIPTAATLP